LELLRGFPWDFPQAERAGLEFEFAAEEKDAHSVVVEVSEAAGRGFQILNPAIESLSHSISDMVGKVVDQAGGMSLECTGHALNGLKA
jgi:hypothetical protein